MSNDMLPNGKKVMDDEEDEDDEDETTI